MVEKTKKLKEELFQVRAQLERTSSAKLDEMLNIASASTTVFVPLSNNVESENTNVKTALAIKNLDKGKSILGAPLKQDKKEIKNSRAKK